MAESYGGPVGVVVWGEDMVHHVTLMVRGGGVRWHSVRSPPPQTLTWPSTWHGPSGVGSAHYLPYHSLPPERGLILDVDLILDVVVLLCVLLVVSVKTVVSSFVASFDLCPDRVRGPKDEGCARTSATNLPMNWVSGSSLPYAKPSSEAIVGLGRELAKEFELAMKLSSNSLARWSKDEMEDDFSWLYHIRAGPLRVVGKGTMAYTIPANVWTCCVRPRNASVETTGGLGFSAGEENPESLSNLQYRFGVGIAVFGSSTGKQGVCPVAYKVGGRIWVNPLGCSKFRLLVGRSCDISPPSSAENVIELSRSC
ncbi:hypothetical protein BHE74_00025313 [Ensete ventricosum]|nr:hypothetical protein BHE74_00025313 [Ensete ventricosum]